MQHHGGRSGYRIARGGRCDMGSDHFVRSGAAQVGGRQWTTKEEEWGGTTVYRAAIAPKVKVGRIGRQCHCPSKATVQAPRHPIHSTSFSILESSIHIRHVLIPLEPSIRLNPSTIQAIDLQIISNSQTKVSLLSQPNKGGQTVGETPISKLLAMVLGQSS